MMCGRFSPLQKVCALEPAALATSGGYTRFVVQPFFVRRSLGEGGRLLQGGLLERYCESDNGVVQASCLQKIDSFLTTNNANLREWCAAE
ncbi:MAG: hypothetical protein PHO37_04760 [Kiritimatiellae bacterium]|nr:hypothetical protein [Kiritimatiellia bacterium]